MIEEPQVDGYGYYYKQLPKIDIDLFQEIADWINCKIERENLVWDQLLFVLPTQEAMNQNYHASGLRAHQVNDDWCGTACCVSGYAELTQLSIDQVIDLDIGNTKVKVTNPEGEVLSTDTHADAGAHILGLTPTEQNLFSGANKKKDVLEGLRQIAKSRGYFLEI